MRNGVTHTILERERLTLAATTLPQVLKSAGYTTGIFGKWHLGDEEPYQPQHRGFDETFIHGAGGIGQAYSCSCADVPGNKYFDPVIRHNGSFVKTTGFCTDVFFTAALGWIQQAKDKDSPFFAYITTNAPHGPFIAPPQNAKRFTDLGFREQPAGFFGMIENIDENVGRLLEKLQAWNLLEDTLIIFMSDNGMTGEGGGSRVFGHAPDGTALEAYNAGMKGFKGSPDEGGVRVPFFVRWDGRIEAGRHRPRRGSPRHPPHPGGAGRSRTAGRPGRRAQSLAVDRIAHRPLARPLPVHPPGPLADGEQPGRPPVARFRRAE